MNTLTQRLKGLGPERLLGMRRGLEKESLRVAPNGRLALSPHPSGLGSALTHPHITTDYSESQLELITGVHDSVQACLAELTRVHQAVYHVLAETRGTERLWVSSMPCGLPTDETIPIARYGSSNIGRAKSIYRNGLGLRYGRRMQMISGIHYNWSLPGLSNSDYFSLIRNFRRHAFVPLVLFGASPAVCGGFVAGRTHELLPIPGTACGTMHLPHATTLRMGRLGYQSDAQSRLAVSYNSLEGYANSLHTALTEPYPLYDIVGVRSPGGEYNQLATSLLQIENEFYGLIRPKRAIRSGERPLHALRERGVEYVEVRCMDLNPFLAEGIDARTMHFLDVFLLHCLLSESPSDTPEEIAALGRNQHRTAARGREPDLLLERDEDVIVMNEWAREILRRCEPIAEAMDAAFGGTDHRDAVVAAQAGIADMDQLPSARVLQGMLDDHGGNFAEFTQARCEMTRQHLMDLPWPESEARYFAELAETSRVRRREIEAADTLPFEEWRQNYVSSEGLTV